MGRVSVSRPRAFSMSALDAGEAVRDHLGPDYGFSPG
jgi:hypothetical protein